MTDHGTLLHHSSSGSARFKASILVRKICSAVNTICLQGSAPVPSILKMK